jgi:hypothetical protein
MMPRRPWEFLKILLKGPTFIYGNLSIRCPENQTGYIIDLMMLLKSLQQLQKDKLILSLDHEINVPVSFEKVARIHTKMGTTEYYRYTDAKTFPCFLRYKQININRWCRNFVDNYIRRKPLKPGIKFLKVNSFSNAVNKGALEAILFQHSGRIGQKEGERQIAVTAFFEMRPTRSGSDTVIPLLMPR